MVDVLTKKQRSYNMSRIKGRDTKPEFIVRKIVHGLGCRYRLHNANLPGKPDIVLPRHKKIIFVHGCFWHMHRCRFGRVKPATHARFWQDKRRGNVIRDKRCLKSLRNAGWKVLVLWECQTRDLGKLSVRLVKFLKS
jgi:DNA mismatch endonuclease, patch repair protein